MPNVLRAVYTSVTRSLQEGQLHPQAIDGLANLLHRRYELIIAQEISARTALITNTQRMIEVWIFRHLLYLYN